MEREGRWGQNRTRNSKRGGRYKQGGQRGTETKRVTLVENVSHYRELYEGEGDN